VSFREDGHAAVDWAADYLERVGALPVLAQVAPGEIRARLPAAPPDQGELFATVLRDLDQILLPGITHWQSPRFFAYFSVSASPPGILAELLAATLNNVAVNWRAAPASTELEAVVLDWLAQLLGLPAGWHGHIEDTASISTVAALAAAREATGKRVAVFSEHANVAVEKAARLVGLEPRKIPGDDEFRLDLDELDLADAAAVVATVGTTATTSVDPVAALADACAEAGTWLHVDAAFAGAAWVCPEFAWSREGVDRADSLVVNAHKWLLTPMDCSCLWTRRPEDLRNAFSLVPEYLRTSEEASLNLSDYGPALGRRFRSLKLWAVLRCYGRAGLQAVIREHVRLARLFASWVESEPGWTIEAPYPFSTVCFRAEASDEENEALVDRVNATGEIFLSGTRLRGRYVIRLSIGNIATTESDVARAWAVLREAANRSTAPVEQA
jgi:aromatic-L-amino-acid decarboxylase